jgi:Holliday junction resolvase RusA-like endonuclease
MARTRPSRPKPRSSVVRPRPEAASEEPGAFLTRYEFTIPGDPVPKGRPRVVNGHTYTDARTINAERQVRSAWVKGGFKLIRSPIRVELRFYRATARRVDWDNLAKLTCDALNGAAWDDDNQIVTAEVHKGIDRDNPRTDVIIEAIAGLSPVDWAEFWEDSP